MRKVKRLKRESEPEGSRPALAAMRLGRVAYMALGFLMVALGVIGAFLPVMPTTVFLILAAWCFGRSSPRLEAWLLDHPRFGPALRDWREHGAMPRRAKLMAWTGMALGYAIFLFTAQPALWLAVVVAIFMAGSAAYVATRPESRRATPPA